MMRLIVNFRRRSSLLVAGIALIVGAAVLVPGLLQAGEAAPASSYSLLGPIRSGNLTVFPVGLRPHKDVPIKALVE
jgi:hypothetical protein